MNDYLTREEQALIWDYYKPRHTHTWNMVVLSWRELDQVGKKSLVGFELEYSWENFILRLWLYRTAVNTLTKLVAIEIAAKRIITLFDEAFIADGENGLKALRNMIEHFDDYAAGAGRGPATRTSDLDPWRVVSADRYERGRFLLERGKSYEAAIKLRLNAKLVSDEFIQWYKSSKQS